jgi:hypothetical protein
LGRLLAEGQFEFFDTIRPFASDPRWRIRAAVAQALQRLGDVNMSSLVKEMEVWCRGNLFERRAAAAALCEPKLLQQPRAARATLRILEGITASIIEVEDRKREDFRVLRKGLAYCWSVAVAALPEEGKARMEIWFGSQDKDVSWLMRENLKKKRLSRMDSEWVNKWQARLAG